MTKKQLQFGILFFTIFIDMLGFGIVIPVLPRYAEVLGATSWDIGMVVGIFSLAQLVMLPFWGQLSDRIGRKPVLMISVFGTVVGYLMMGWTRSIMIIMVARAVDGAAGANMSTVQAYISDTTKFEERSRAMGFLGAAYGLGFIMGPALGGWAAHRYGFSSPMFIAAGLAGLNLLFIMTLLPESRQKQQVVLKPPSLFSVLKYVNKKIYVPAVLTYFFMITGLAVMTTLLALFVYHHYNLNELQTGYIYAMWGVIAIVIEGGVFGFCSRYFSDRWLVVLGTVVLMAAFFFLPLTRCIQVALIICAGIGLGDSLIAPALPALVSRSVDNDWQGRALGFYQSAGSLARFVGPLIAGFFLTFDLYKSPEHYAQTAFWVASGLLLLAFLCSLKIPREVK